MREITEIQSINFKLTLKGRGIVNCESNENYYWVKNNNFTPAKKNIYPDRFFFKDSSYCIKHAIYDSMGLSNVPANIRLFPELFYGEYLTSPAILLRGCAELNSKGRNKRKSPVGITDAEEIGEGHPVVNNRPQCNFELHTRSGYKNTDDTNSKDTTLFFREETGDITTVAQCWIDVEELQFISADDIYDRMYLDTDGGVYEELFLDGLKKNLKYAEDERPELKAYKIFNSIAGDAYAERGILLNHASVDMLVKMTLKSILNLSIKRSNAYRNAVPSLALEIRTAYGCETVEVTPDNIDEFTFVPHAKYTEVDYSEIIKRREAFKAMSTSKEEKKPSKRSASKTSNIEE